MTIWREKYAKIWAWKRPGNIGFFVQTLGECHGADGHRQSRQRDIDVHRLRLIKFYASILNNTIRY